MPLRFSSSSFLLTVALLLATGLAAQQPQQPPPAAAQEGSEAAATQEGEPTEASEEGEEEAPQPPPLPPTPDGILPLSELARITYAPRERPRPTLFGDTLVIVTTAGSIDGYDAATGEFSWKLGLPGETLFRPQTIEGSSDRLLVASTSGRLLVLDRMTGGLQEEHDLGLEIAMPPLVSGSELALVTPAGEVVLYDWASRSERFRAPTGEPALGLAWSRDLVVVSGALRTLTAIDAREGSTAWTFTGRGPFRAAATIGGNGRVYTGDDLGEFYSLGGEDGKVKFRWSTGAALRLSPLVEGNRVYVATLGNNLYSYGAGGGAEQWRTSLPGRPVLGPLRIHQRFLIVTYEGVFVEVQPERGRLTTSWAAPGELAAPPSFRIVPAPLVPVVPSPTPSTALDDGDVAETRAPLWFERSRVAFALGNGDVVLARHQIPVSVTPTPTEGSELTEEGLPKEPAAESPEGSERPPPPPPPTR